MEILAAMQAERRHSGVMVRQKGCFQPVLGVRRRCSDVEVRAAAGFVEPVARWQTASIHDPATAFLYSTVALEVEEVQSLTSS